MSALVLTLLRLGFLALLWIFVFSVVFTLRRDVYGTQVRDRRALVKGAAREGFEGRAAAAETSVVRPRASTGAREASPGNRLRTHRDRGAVDRHVASAWNLSDHRRTLTRFRPRT